MNDSYLNCFSIYDEIVRVLPVKRSILVAFYIILFILNTVMNNLSIYVNITTNHWKNQSMRMILYISVNDILYAVIGLTAHVVHILIPEQLDCQQRRFLLLFPHLFITLCFYTIVFVALDRFLHVMLLERYRIHVTSAKFNSILAFYLLVAVEQCVIANFGPIFFGENGGALYSASVNLLFITGTISINIASIIKLNIYAKTSRTVGSKTANLDKLATAFLISITVTYLPLLIFTAILKMFKEEMGTGNAIFLFHSLLLLSNLNSSLNAFAYLKLNRKARRKVNSLILNRVQRINESEVRTEHYGTESLCNVFLYIKIM